MHINKMAVSLTILIVALVCVCLYLILYFTSSTSNSNPAPSTTQIPNTQNITASTTTSTNPITSNSASSGQQTPNTSNQLGIRVLKEGTGVAAKNGDTISVLYTGKLTNGTVFDASSLHGNKPFSFVIGSTGPGSVIQGWNEGLVGAKAGEELELTIPPQLGYGSNPPPNSPIKADSTLVFDITVQKIN